MFCRRLCFRPLAVHGVGEAKDGVSFRVVGIDADRDPRQLLHLGHGVRPIVPELDQHKARPSLLGVSSHEARILRDRSVLVGDRLIQVGLRTPQERFVA